MKEFDLPAIGKRIKELRRKLGLSQEKLGQRMNLSKATICDYEKGNTPPSFEFLYYFSGLTEVSVDSLVRPENELKNKECNNKSLPLYNREFNELLDLMKKSPVVLSAVISMANSFIGENKSVIEENLQLEKEINEKY